MTHGQERQAVLIVEDEADIRELLSEYFRARNFDVVGAADGRAAVLAIEREPERFSLIVTDLHLPGVDGLAVLRAARAANPAVYVVIVTGFASLDSAIQAVRLGAYDYLTKPFSLGQIDVVLAADPRDSGAARREQAADAAGVAEGRRRSSPGAADAARWHRDPPDPHRGGAPHPAVAVGPCPTATPPPAGCRTESGSYTCDGSLFKIIASAHRQSFPAARHGDAVACGVIPR